MKLSNFLYKYFLGIVFFAILIVKSAFSQETQEKQQLAYQFFQKKEFDKAAPIFNQLFSETDQKYYFDFYLQCIIEQKLFEEAEKIVKKQIKTRRNNSQFIVDLGYVYKSQSKIEEATEQFDLALKKLQPGTVQTIELANAFASKREYEYAEKTYTKGKENTGQPFHYELSFIYAAQLKYPQMIEEMLAMLDENEQQIQIIQNSLQYYLTNSADDSFANELRTALLRRIQKKLSQPVFNRMLIWMLIQQNDFENAFVQAKALDKRGQNSGTEIIELGNIALENKKYDLAFDVFNYLIVKKNENNQYFEASKGILNVQYRKIVDLNINTSSVINKTISEYQNFIKEFGTTPQTIFQIRDYAHLLAFYQQKPQDALNLLLEALKNKTISLQLQGICKIELGDIYMYSGNVWDATLTYGQAELENKNNPIGDEAKFKKAKIAYYTGQFKWALAQLDVLKASTSKLIANDAFDVAQLIKDNSEADSVGTVLQIYARADLLSVQNKDSLSILALDSILSQYSTSPLCDDVLYKKAAIYSLHQKYEKAADMYQQIIDKYSFDILGDDSMFKLAELSEFFLNNKPKAQELYKEIMVRYPGSSYVVEARKRFRNIRGS